MDDWLKFIKRLLTQFRVLSLRVVGYDVHVGRKSIVAWSVSLTPAKGSIKIGSRCTISAHCMIGCSRGSISVGDGCFVGMGSIIGAGNGKVVIGSDIFIGPYCVLSGGGDISLGNESMIASHARVYSSEHTIDETGMAMSRLPMISKGVTIGSDVWIGSGATVLDGSSIADGCVIGAGAVLKARTDARSIYVGIPARKMRARKPASAPHALRDGADT